MIAIGPLQFMSGAMLLLLLALPAWWIVRRGRERPAIVFSRTGVLAEGPRAGRRVTRMVFVSRNVLLAGTVLALARPRTGARRE